VCGWAAWLLPLSLGVWSANGAPGWHGDLATVRDLGLVPVGSEGVLSSVACQLAALLPVGGKLLRGALVGVVALAVCSRVAFSLFRDLLDRRAAFALNPLLALLASQLWALSPEVQRPAASIGSAALALSLLLLLLRFGTDSSATPDARRLSLGGVLLGLTLGESHAAAAIGLALLLLHWAFRPQRLPERVLVAWLVGLCAAAGLCWLLPVLRPFAPHAWLDLGSIPVDAAAFSRQTLETPSLAELGAEVLALWTERVGSVGLALGLLGFGVALERPPLRRALLPWVLLLALGVLVPLARVLGLVEASGLFALASSLSLVACLPLALQAAARWLWYCPVPFGRPASVLSLTFAVTLVLQQLDRMAPVAAPDPSGAEAWTEQALGRLPPRSLALVRSPALAWRLMASQMLHAERPDVLVVPEQFLSRGSLTAQLLSRDAGLSPLLRQLAVNGFPDEYSLCQLADTRPVFVELDPKWDARLLEHLRPDALWLGFSSHTITRLERAAGVARSRAALRAVYGSVAASDALGATTREALVEQAGQQALLLAGVGDRDNAALLLRALDRLGSSGPLGSRLEARLRERERGRVAIHDLTE
jgi:hypothetical protein